MASIERQLEESWVHIEPYMTDEDTTKELRKMCDCCERYCGKDHDYSECRNLPCFKFWLSYEYLLWENAWD